MNSFPALRAGVRLVLLLSIFVPLQAGAETVDEVHGSITVDGETYELANILVDPARTFPLSILVSDVHLPPPCEPLDAMAFVEKTPFSGVLFTIGEDLAPWPSLNSLYHPSLEPNQGYGQVGTGLDMKRSGPAIQGTLRDVIELDGREFAIDLEMTVAMPESGRSMTPRTIRGADSEPKRAFEAMVDGVIAGDVAAMLAHSSSDMRAELESAGELDSELLFEFADWMLPSTITILDAQIDGDVALLKAKGETVTCMGTESSDGEIEMVREGGGWKVKRVKWQG